MTTRLGQQGTEDDDCTLPWRRESIFISERTKERTNERKEEARVFFFFSKDLRRRRGLWAVDVIFFPDRSKEQKRRRFSLFALFTLSFSLSFSLFLSRAQSIDTQHTPCLAERALRRRARARARRERGSSFHHHRHHRRRLILPLPLLPRLDTLLVSTLFPNSPTTSPASPPSLPRGGSPRPSAPRATLPGTRPTWPCAPRTSGGAPPGSMRHTSSSRRRRRR